jgi:hypothetical protein
LLHKLLAFVHRPLNDKFSRPACWELSQLVLELDVVRYPPGAELEVPLAGQVGSIVTVEAELGTSVTSGVEATNGVAEGLRGLFGTINELSREWEGPDCEEEEGWRGKEAERRGGKS